MTYTSEQWQAYYQKNREKILKKKKIYRDKNAKKIYAKAKEWRNATPYNFVRYKVLAQKNAAKGRGMVWELDVDATIAKILRQGRCKLSGDKFVYKQGKGRGNKNPYAPSIDRIDSRKGYIPGNVMFINWENNNAKGDMSLYRYKRMCAKVAKVAL